MPNGGLHFCANCPHFAAGPGRCALRGVVIELPYRTTCRNFGRPGGEVVGPLYPDARRQLGRFLDAVYNRKRIHSALGYLTPVEFEQQWRADRKGPPAVQFGAAPTGLT